MRGASDAEVPDAGGADRSGAAPATRIRYATEDRDEADDILRRSYPSGYLHQQTPIGAFRHEVDTCGSVTVGRMAFRGAFTTGGDLDGVVCIVEPLAGAYDWRVDDEAGTAATPHLMHPGQRLAAASDDVATRVVNLDFTALEDFARALYGDEHLRLSFDGATARSPELERAWRDAVDQVEWVLRDPALDDADLLRTSQLRRLAVTTLEAFRLRADPVERHESFRSRRRAYRRARAFIDDHAHEPITVDDVCRFVGLSRAALAELFAAHAATTPETVIRRTRLAAAHDDLISSDAATVTVAQIAHRWGFPDEEFRRRYLATFRVMPEETLGR